MKKEAWMLIVTMVIGGLLPAAALLYVFREPIAASEVVDLSRWPGYLVAALAGAVVVLFLGKGRQSKEAASASGRAYPGRFLDSQGLLGLLVLDANDRVLFANAVFCRMAKDKPENLAGQSLTSLVPSLKDKDTEAARRLGGEATEPVDVMLKVSDGSPYRIKVSMGQVGSQLYVAAEDQSERLKLSSFRSQLISSLSHEVRTPLTSMTAALKMILSGQLGKLEPKALEMAALAENSAQTLIRFINELSDLQKLQENQLQLSFKALDLEELLEQAAREFRIDADLRGERLKVQAELGGVRVLADRRRLANVLNILLSHMIRYAVRDAEIILSAAAEDSRAEVTIRASKGGIPQQLADLARKEFNWVELDRDSFQQAGMAVVAGVLGQHGTEVSLSGEEGNLGFSFSLPLCGTLPPESPGEPTSGQQGGSSLKSVLYLEDDESLSALVAMLLQDRVEITTARTVSEAYSILKSRKFDLLLSDMTLPDGAGLEVVQYARRNRLAAKCVLYSAFEAEGSMVDEYDRCFVKSREPVQEVVEEVLELLGEEGGA